MLRDVAMNVAGHASGVVLFAIFLVLAVRRHGVQKANWLSLLAASLSLLWNLASIGVLISGVQNSPIGQILATLGFSLLSLLPAVLFHLCVGWRLPRLVYSGYGLSLIATALHLAELLMDSADLHRTGLSLITIGFGALTAIAVFRIFWSSEQQARLASSRITATMSLFLFAISFGHFSEGHIDQAWSQELLMHHAGIPLALFVLLQDYRFVLADAFIRLVANGFLAVLAGWSIVVAIAGRSELAQIALAIALVILFAVVRQLLQQFLMRLVFRQPDPRQVDAALANLRSFAGTETEFLHAAGAEMSRLMKATLLNGDVLGTVAAHHLVSATLVNNLSDSRELQRQGISVVVPIRTAAAESRFVLLGERQGGRPYRSMDLDVLSRLSGAAAEQLERIRTLEIDRLVSQAELRALQAQIHPHFLFNALNTLYGIIPREAAAARKTVLNLADIFRYFLRSDTAFVPLEEELNVVRAYLAIEAHRLGSKLTVEMAVDESLLRESVPVLSIEPLVENAIKHGVGTMPEGGTVRIEVKREGEAMRVLVSDTGLGLEERGKPASFAGAGVGLDNVARRLQLCYGLETEMILNSSSDGAQVGFRVPCRKRDLVGV